MRSVFIGAVHGSAVGLRALIQSGQPPVAVVTLPAEKAGRHSDFADIGTVAREAGIDVIETTNINSADTLMAIRDLKPDLCLVIGWSQICGSKFLALSKQGNIGFHPAPLPRLRGRAVIPWTILLGLENTASTLFWIDEGTDSGPILLQRSFAVASDETAQSLYDKHTDNLAVALPQAVSLVRQRAAPREVQDHSLASYCARRRPEDGLIDWNAPAEDVLRLVRALGGPYPPAFTSEDKETLEIFDARPLSDSWRYVGLTGQVQAHTENGFIVRCGDRNCVEVVTWKKPTGSRPKLHAMLGR